MFSRLPPPFGKPSTKVVFESVAPGSPAAQLLYHQHQAQISRFQHKARQYRDISDQPGVQMQQALPGGGQMRYSYNNGLEIVTVRLSPTEVARAEQQARNYVQPFDPVLAIDILFVNRLLDVSHLYTYWNPASPLLSTSEDFYGYFDVLNIAALRVEGAQAYEAISLQSGTDPRLKPLRFVDPATETSRKLEASDEALNEQGFYENLTGAGFAARPRADQQLTVIDVYLATDHVYKENARPGIFTGDPGSVVEIDDPTMTYSPIQGVTYSIRAREFVLDRPVPVRVTTETERRRRQVDFDDFPAEPTNRTAVWAFAATQEWSDTGGEPAAPDAVAPSGRSTMGRLLASVGPQTAFDVATTQPDRRFHNAPEWSRPVTEMTKVAEIRWTPPTSAQGHGKATISNTVDVQPFP